MSAKIGVVSLGCDKNLVDTETALAECVSAGYEITADENEADVLIVNTCAFIESARNESIDEIFNCLAHKKKRNARVIVSGCLPERYREELAEAIPEADAFIGVSQYGRMADVVRSVLEGKRVVDFSPCGKVPSGRILATPKGSAFLKIAEGCGGGCSFCAIPSIRGKYRSRPMESLLDEARGLVETKGVREINVIAQDVASYGRDLYGRSALTELLEKLSRLDVEWIRLLYCRPELVSDELIDAIAGNDRICAYLDVPLQHVSDRILSLMNRGTDGKRIRALVRKLHDRGIAVRSSFIVGFPTETERDFGELTEFLEEYRIEYAGFFAYSREEGTPAAALPGRPGKKVSRRRLEEAAALQTRIIEENNARYVGKTLKVLCEGFSDGRAFGRPEFCAPDADAAVLFEDGGTAREGEFSDVRITGRLGIDLVGETV